MPTRRGRVSGVQPHQTVHEHMHERDDEPEFFGAASLREPLGGLREKNPPAGETENRCDPRPVALSGSAGKNSHAERSQECRKRQIGS
jgi:hypothetical protein